MDIKDEMESKPNDETNKSSDEQISLKVNILKNRFILTNIRMALFLGVLGCILTVFAQGFYLRSQWTAYAGSYLLTMNACCFILVGIAVMSYGSRFYKLL